MADEWVQLPRPGGLEGGLGEVLWRRRSSYRYGARKLRLVEVADLLGNAVGVSRRVAAYGRDDHGLGLAPSAGGLPSVGVYVVPLLVAELPAGVFDYDRDGHRLVLRVPAVSRADMAAALVQPEFAELAAALVVLTIRTGPGVAKYGLRHVRTMAVIIRPGTARRRECSTRSGITTVG